MILPTLTLVYDRKKVATTSKEAPVELRIGYERKSKWMSTGIRLLPKHWRGHYVTNRPDAAELNDALDLIVQRVRKVINTMVAEGNVNIGEIPSRLAMDSKDSQSFLEFCEERARVRMYGKKGDTMERYTRFLKWFREWGRIVYFSDVTDTNIMKMDAELVATGMKNYSKWQNYHRFLNSYIIDAVEEGYVKRNPYKWLHIDKDKTNGLHKCLTLAEFRRIESAKMPTESLERVRDLFVFQTYTCLSYTDMASFDYNDVVNGMYTGNRGKTGKEFTFVLMGGAKRVLEKYKYKLPIISNEKYNSYVKMVAQAAGIDKNLTTHWARHTGATMMLNEGVDAEVIAKILGDSVRQVRETYAKMLDSTVADVMGSYEKRLNRRKVAV